MTHFRTRLALLGTAAVLTAGAAVPAQFAGAQPAAAADRKQWVALGGSYTAGVIRAAGNTFEVPRDGCERTDRAYPQVIDRDLGGLFELTNVSCGAATIDNVTDTPQHPIGRHQPPLSVPNRLKTMRHDYDRMLAALHQRDPHAKILAVGYPTVIPRDAATCSFGDLTRFGTITQGDLAWLRQGVLESLNKAIDDSTGT
ncbi:hypothetical protein [Streptomyces manipurensis]|uniref:hypothetical protein n=1 Tax=Streptomyces manipurensis TaxID=1077945 RepID=UPI003C6F857B